MGHIHAIVAGASGYLGSALIHHLLHLGWTVTALVRSHPKPIQIPGLSYWVWNPLDPETLTDLQDADVAFHLTCPRMAECHQDMEGALREHVAATRHLLSRLQVRNRIFYISSCSVYGHQEGLVTEETPPNPLSPYAWVKLAGEEAVAETEATCPTIIVRLATVYGVGSVMRSDLLVNRLVLEATVTGKIVIQGPELWRCFVHLHDAVHVLGHLTTVPIGRCNEVVCVGAPGQVMRLVQLGELIRANHSSAFLTLTDGVADPRNYRVQFDRMTALVGSMDFTPITVGITELIRFYRSNEGGMWHERIAGTSTGCLSRKRGL